MRLLRIVEDRIERVHFGELQEHVFLVLTIVAVVGAEDPVEPAAEALADELEFFREEVVLLRIVLVDEVGGRPVEIEARVIMGIIVVDDVFERHAAEPRGRDVGDRPHVHVEGLRLVVDALVLAGRLLLRELGLDVRIAGERRERLLVGALRSGCGNANGSGHWTTEVTVGGSFC